MVIFKVVTYGGWSLNTRSGRYERVDCNIILINLTHIMMSHF